MRMVRHNLIILLVVYSLFLSCVPEKGSEEFLAPEIVSAEAVVVGEAVSLACELSAARVQTCGFVYWSGEGGKVTVNADISDASFSVALEGLRAGQTYQWYAFAKAGDSEVHSAINSFTVPDLAPEQDPEPVPDPTPDPEDAVSIPDPYFKRYLLEYFDSDKDGFLTEEEGLAIRKIDVVTDKISSMRGIERFKNLDSLICRGTDVNEYDNIGHPGLLDSLDVSANRKLRYLACDGNMIRHLNISDNPFIETLVCGWNLLDNIDLSTVPKLRTLNISHNPLVSVDLSRCLGLYALDCSGCEIGMLDISMLPSLKALKCSPMENIDGVNLLRKLLVGVGQIIQNVTVARSPLFVPDETSIVAESLSAGVEGYGGGEYDP